MDLNNFTEDNCGTLEQPGLAVDIYFSCSCEHQSWPQTKEEIALAASGTPNPGDSVVLDEPFDFAAAGFWRKYTAIVDTTSLTDTLEGEVGGQGYMTQLPFEIKGDDAERLEFANRLAGLSGCAIAMVKTRKGLHRVIGSKDVPATLESAEIKTGAKTGEKVGGAYVLKASTGKVAPIYNVSVTNVIKIAAT